MKLLKEIRSRIGSLLKPFAFVFVISYTYYHMFSGGHGLITWYDLSTQVAIIEGQNRALQNTINIQASKISKLSTDNMDPDFLDEQIRKNLAYVREDEQVLFIK